MLKISKILVCTDFSSYSNNAIIMAEKIRKITKAKVFAIHVSELSINWDWMPPNYTEGGYQVELLKSLTQKLRYQLDENNLNGEARIVFGIIPNAINEFIEGNDIDMVIISHKGKSGHFAMGSVASKIIASVNKPVFIVKKNIEIDHVSCLVDPYGEINRLMTFSQEFIRNFNKKLKIISLVPDIAARYIGVGKIGFSTELLSLSENQKHKIISEIKDRLTKKIDQDISATFLIEVSTEKKVSYHLNRILEKENISLAIMQRHQSTFLEKILIGSETRRLLEIFDNNLLIIPPP